MTQKRIIKYCSATLLVIAMSFTTKNRLINYSQENKMNVWYCQLLNKSMHFVNEDANKHFIDSLQQYMDTCRIYNFSKDSRLEPYMCQPILLNKAGDKAVVLILKRIFNLKHERSENVLYVSAKKENNHWVFKLNTVQVDGFDYFKNHPTISDTEIGIKILGRLVQYGYLKEGELYSEKLFSSPIYAFK